MSNKKEKIKKSAPPQIYSGAFKRQVVSELESGLNTKAGLKRKYGIAGNSCLPRWCKQFGKLTYKDQYVKGRPMKDPNQQKIIPRLHIGWTKIYVQVADLIAILIWRIHTKLYGKML
jgi:transposase-like protein